MQSVMPMSFFWSDFDECASNPCQNNATCQEEATIAGRGAFKCTCTEGWMGDTCSGMCRDKGAWRDEEEEEG